MAGGGFGAGDSSALSNTIHIGVDTAVPIKAAVGSSGQLVTDKTFAAISDTADSDTSSTSDIARSQAAPFSSTGQRSNPETAKEGTAIGMPAGKADNLTGSKSSFKDTKSVAGASMSGNAAGASIISSDSGGGGGSGTDRAGKAADAAHSSAGADKGLVSSVVGITAVSVDKSATVSSSDQPDTEDPVTAPSVQSLNLVRSGDTAVGKLDEKRVRHQAPERGAIHEVPLAGSWVKDGILVGDGSGGGGEPDIGSGNPIGEAEVIKAYRLWPSSIPTCNTISLRHTPSTPKFRFSLVRNIHVKGCMS